MHSYRDENHYKVRLNNDTFQKYFQNQMTNTFQTKHFQSELATKSPWITTDEKGANTFPFHNLPPELKKTS